MPVKTIAKKTVKKAVKKPVIKLNKTQKTAKKASRYCRSGRVLW